MSIYNHKRKEGFHDQKDMAAMQTTLALELMKQYS